MEINLLITLDLAEQAALQAALVTRGAPDSLMTLALTGACRLGTIEEARSLRHWLGDTRARGELGDPAVNAIERSLLRFGV